MSKAAHRRAAAVSRKLAARGLGDAFVWEKKLDRDLSRGLVPDITSFRSERRCCLARLKEAEAVRASAGACRRRSPPPNPAAPLAKAAAEAAKEAAFLLEQGRLRAEARLAAGRAKPIDVLVASLNGARRRALDAFRGAPVEALTELGENIAAMAVLDRDNEPFWEAAKIMCYAEMKKAAGGTAGHGKRLLHAAILTDVKGIVEGKNLEELGAMPQSIAERMAAGEDKTAEHWQGFAELIKIERAKKYLEHNYSTGDDTPPSFHNNDGDSTPTEGGDGDGTAGATDEKCSEPLRAIALPQTDGPDRRKPRYVARVRSGYEWTKYNRVHYDHDHPPPKTVRGYKFAVYYPDLAGAGAGAVPPRYTVEEDGGGETCILRFRAGWPYEDVAFRIPNREWEYSPKAGFRSTFESGVLRLEFNLKRFSYRR